MFKGRYNHTVDTKGRVMIPSKFRDQLGKEFVITRGFENCLFVYTNEAWDAYAEKLLALPTNDEDSRRVVRSMIGYADDVELDNQGRALLSKELRAYANLDKNIMLVGMGNRIEIWDVDELEKYESQGDVKTLAQNMFDKGIHM